MTQGLEKGAGQVPYQPEGVMDRGLEPDQPLVADGYGAGPADLSHAAVLAMEGGTGQSDIQTELADALSLETSIHMHIKAEGARQRIARKFHSGGTHVETTVEEPVHMTEAARERIAADQKAAAKQAEIAAEKRSPRRQRHAASIALRNVLKGVNADNRSPLDSDAIYSI